MTLLSGKELARLVESKGWILLRVNGSHHIYSKPGFSVRLSIPMHGSSKLKVGLQRHLMKRVSVTAVLLMSKHQQISPLLTAETAVI